MHGQRLFLWKDVRCAGCIWPFFRCTRSHLSTASISVKSRQQKHEKGGQQRTSNCSCRKDSIRHNSLVQYHSTALKTMVNFFSSTATRLDRDAPSCPAMSSVSVSPVATPKVKQIYRGLQEGNRASLAEAITLVESSHPLKHQQAQWLLTKILVRRHKQLDTRKLKPTIRIGLSGPPGCGKSTLIETLGLLLLNQGMKVAVLAVDPSSSRTGGSILGDKTRMIRLSQAADAYIRPSPSRGSLGGVTRNTNEAIILCEGAGYDVIIVETVGVGQSETSVCDMVDVFTLIIPPAAGDELQGLKRGIVELADVVVINKADGDLLPAARRIKAEYVSALKLTRSKNPHWRAQVLMMSALHNEGVCEVWEKMKEYCNKMKEVGVFEWKRRQQQRLWLWSHINWQLQQRFKSHPGMAEHVAAMEGRVVGGSVAPGTACDLLLDHFFLTLPQHKENQTDT